MNDGKICISICAEYVDELKKQIARAETYADIIEIRLDCLKTGFAKSDVARIASTKTLLYTFRPTRQGGNASADPPQRREFWVEFIKFLDQKHNDCILDFEHDLKLEIEESKFQIINSKHNFDGVPDDLIELFDQLSKRHGITKIAMSAKEITDSLPIWRLLLKSKSQNKKIIPIAMGDAGKWTRILGLAHGAFLTYASLDSGKETAPGQILAEDLVEVYRAKQLDENTGVYGIIAGNTSYSMSPYIHNAAFKFHKLNSVFVPLQVQNLDEFMRRMVLEKTREVELNFKGFSVTNPHKQSIIRYLDEVDATAKKIGAVNTVKIENEKLYGYNTDAQGFIEPLKRSYGDLSGANVAVIGNGGAARACVYALKNERAEVTIFARNMSAANQFAEEFGAKPESISNLKSQISNFDVVVNSTPLGTKGEREDQTPLFSDEFKNIHLAYDLVYNPFETRFLREAKIADVPTIGGFAMLIAQAMAQSEIWTGKEAPMKEMSQAALKKLAP
jgi:3-dehydroquinate dehydratase / shikimate dehydrogenase